MPQNDQSRPGMTPEAIQAARDWVGDCLWADLDPEDVAELSPLALVRGIERTYDGGWKQFLWDSGL